MGFKCGIVGLPNVGKSTLFNALTSSKNAQAANFPFCTIDPNIGIVDVPDDRLNILHKLSKSKKKINTNITFVDIAGLVKGASKGEGLGNKFLSHIGSVEGKGEADVSFSTISYSWSVTQPRIQFTDGVGLFTADVSINAGVIRYNTPAKGRVNVTFDDASNTIKFDVQSISFELYTELFGNRIHISDVDIASFFPLDFEMEGPPIFTRRTVLNVPSGTKIIDVSTGEVWSMEFKGIDYLRVNGHPNYYGWGSEDVCISRRCKIVA